MAAINGFSPLFPLQVETELFPHRALDGLRNRRTATCRPLSGEGHAGLGRRDDDPDSLTRTVAPGTDEDLRRRTNNLHLEQVACGLARGSPRSLLVPIKDKPPDRHDLILSL